MSKYSQMPYTNNTISSRYGSSNRLPTLQFSSSNAALPKNRPRPPPGLEDVPSQRQPIPSFGDDDDEFEIESFELNQEELDRVMTQIDQTTASFNQHSASTQLTAHQNQAFSSTRSSSNLYSSISTSTFDQPAYRQQHDSSRGVDINPQHASPQPGMIHSREIPLPENRRQPPNTNTNSYSIRTTNGPPSSHQKAPSDSLDLDTVLAELEKLKSENQSLRSRSDTLLQEKYKKDGEVSIIRSNYTKLEYENLTLKQKLKENEELLNLEKEKIKREAKNEIEKMQTQFLFTQHELQSKLDDAERVSRQRLSMTQVTVEREKDKGSQSSMLIDSAANTTFGDITVIDEASGCEDNVNVNDSILNDTAVPEPKMPRPQSNHPTSRPQDSTSNNSHSLQLDVNHDILASVKSLSIARLSSSPAVDISNDVTRLPLEFLTYFTALVSSPSSITALPLLEVLGKYLFFATRKPDANEVFWVVPHIIRLIQFLVERCRDVRKKLWASTKTENGGCSFTKKRGRDNELSVGTVDNALSEITDPSFGVFNQLIELVKALAEFLNQVCHSHKESSKSHPGSFKQQSDYDPDRANHLKQPLALPTYHSVSLPVIVNSVTSILTILTLLSADSQLKYTSSSLPASIADHLSKVNLSLLHSLIQSTSFIYLFDPTLPSVIHTKAVELFMGLSAGSEMFFRECMIARSKSTGLLPTFTSASSSTLSLNTTIDIESEREQKEKGRGGERKRERGTPSLFGILCRYLSENYEPFNWSESAKSRSSDDAKTESSIHQSKVLEPVKETSGRHLDGTLESDQTHYYQISRLQLTVVRFFSVLSTLYPSQFIPLLCNSRSPSSTSNAASSSASHSQSSHNSSLSQNPQPIPLITNLITLLHFTISSLLKRLHSPFDMSDIQAERLHDLKLQVQIVKSGLRFLGAIVNECFWWSNSDGSVAGVSENGNTNDNGCGKDQQKSSSNMDVDIPPPTDSIMTSKGETQEKENIDKSDHLNLNEDIKDAETNSINVVPPVQLRMPQPDDLLIKAPGMTEQLSYLFVISLVRVISWRKIVPDYFDFLDFQPPSSSSSSFHLCTWTDALQSEWKNVVESERVGNVKELFDDVNEVAKDLLDVLVEEDDQKPIFDLFSSEHDVSGEEG